MRPSLKAKIIIDERRQHFRKVMAFENNVVVCTEAVTMLFQHTLGDCGKNSFFMNMVYRFSVRGRESSHVVSKAVCTVR